MTTEISYGLGQHRSDLSVENYRNFLKYDYLDTAQFYIALATCKISICLFLLRLSQFDRIKRVLWCMIGFVIITHCTLFLLVVFQCNPIHKAWDLGIPGRCFSKQVVVNINIAQGGELRRSSRERRSESILTTCVIQYSRFLPTLFAQPFRLSSYAISAFVDNRTLGCVF